MTYNVSDGMLNLAQSIQMHLLVIIPQLLNVL